MATTWTHGGLFRSGTSYAMDGVCSGSRAPGGFPAIALRDPLPAFLRDEDPVMSGANGSYVLVDCKRLRSTGFKIRAQLDGA